MHPGRRTLLLALAGALTPFSAFGQSAYRTATVGFLGPASPAAYASWLQSLKDRLRELGYIENRNLRLEPRYGNGSYERLAQQAREFARLKVDVIVTSSTPAVREAIRANPDTPIVTALIADPVDMGVVQSLARPGGNVTGMAYFLRELNGKRLELLKEMLPGIKRIAVLANADNAAARSMLQQAHSTSRLLEIELREFRTSGSEQFGATFAAIAADRPDALLITDDPIYNAYAKQIGALCLAHRLAAIGGTEFMDHGVVLAYSVDHHEMFRRAAGYVDKILRGARPSELPIERSSHFRLVVNRKVARTLGVAVPQAVLLRAERTIE
jgi:putative tryptophan/tyrosine transport system substrate-binding protein